MKPLYILRLNGMVAAQSFHLARIQLLFRDPPQVFDKLILRKADIRNKQIMRRDPHGHHKIICEETIGEPT